ncbi:MAG: hypothetical protein AB7P76_09010 [Candidatus Melainabacteria bacterium]
MTQAHTPGSRNKAIEQFLGQQYADALRNSPQGASVYRDCEEVIQGSLSLLDRYNRINMWMRSGAVKTGQSRPMAAAV